MERAGDRTASAGAHRPRGPRSRCALWVARALAGQRAHAQRPPRGAGTGTPRRHWARVWISGRTRAAAASWSSTSPAAMSSTACDACSPRRARVQARKAKPGEAGGGWLVSGRWLKFSVLRINAGHLHPAGNHHSGGRHPAECLLDKSSWYSRHSGPAYQFLRPPPALPFPCLAVSMSNSPINGDPRWSLLHVCHHGA